MISQKDILNAKILVVDDESTNVHVMEILLQTAGFSHIRSTSDSGQALDIYQDFLPDLVLLDLYMPKPDGFEILKRLKVLEGESYLPVIILTARPEQKSRIKALELGARDYIDKGGVMEPTEFISRIRNILEVRLLHNQVRAQNKSLEIKMKETSQKTLETHLLIIQRLVRAVEYRDNETGLHIIRIGKFCGRLGESVGMSKSECDLLSKAAPMHDIGKISIPDSILLKPGKFTEEERETMKTHAAIGGELLAGGSSDLLKMAEIIALTHHEKWDGSGYPKGIKGRGIPLLGRICAVVDVFDALISERPYKKAWHVDEAISEIERGSGSHFDPDLVVHFKKILPELIKIRKSAVTLLARSELPSYEKRKK